MNISKQMISVIAINVLFFSVDITWLKPYSDSVVSEMKQSHGFHPLLLILYLPGLIRFAGHGAVILVSIAAVFDLWSHQPPPKAGLLMIFGCCMVYSFFRVAEIIL